MTVGFVTLALGGIGVMNIMLIAVKERTREIGVRKALGATTSAILRQFFLEGFFITIISGAIGIGGRAGALRGHQPAADARALRGDDPVAPGSGADDRLAGRSSASSTPFIPRGARRSCRRSRRCATRCRRAPSMPTVDAIPAPVVAAARQDRSAARAAFPRHAGAGRGVPRGAVRPGRAIASAPACRCSGISWGIVSVVMLLAYGNGFRDALARGFRQRVRQRRRHLVAGPDQHAGGRRARRPSRARHGRGRASAARAAAGESGRARSSSKSMPVELRHEAVVAT